MFKLDLDDISDDPDNNIYASKFLEKASQQPVVFCQTCKCLPDSFLVALPSSSPYFSKVFEKHPCAFLILFVSRRDESNKPQFM